MARQQNDFYETNPGQVKALLDYLCLPWNTRVLEPCAGSGQIADQIIRDGHLVVTNDIDERFLGLNYYWDAATPEFYAHLKKNKFRFHWIITNPPFNRALDIAKCAMPHAVEGMALLLRITWLEPTKDRAPFLKENPPNRIMVFGSPRPSYSGGKTDSATSAWFIWSDAIEPGIEFVTDWKI